MKKALVGALLVSLLLILAAVTLSFADAQKKHSCDKLADFSQGGQLNEIASQKSYSLRFPVL